MTYVSEVLADSPYLFWKLDDASGTTATDSSGNGRNGTYTGTYTLAAPPVVSELARAVNLNPSTNNGYVGATLSSFAPTALTYEAWITTTDTNFGLMSYASSSSADEFLVFPTSASVITVYVRGTVQSFTLPFSYQNRRAHIVATWRSSDGRVQVWINGFLAGSGTAGTGLTLTTGGQFLVGQDQDTVGGGGLAVGDAMTARVNCVAIYTSVLSDARIAAHYVAGSYIDADAIPYIAPTELTALTPNAFNFDKIEMFSAGVTPINPTVSISPGASAVAPIATVSVTVTETSPFDHVLRVRDDVTNAIELIAIGGGSVPAAAVNPSKYAVAAVTISGGYRYDITAPAGWKHPFTVLVDAYSTTTGHTATSTAYTLTTSPTTATVTNFSPATSSVLTPSGTVVFDVLDDQPFEHVVFIRHDNTGEFEFIGYGAGAAPAAAVAGSRFTLSHASISHGYRYTLAAVGGWKFPFTVYVRAYGRTINGEAEVTASGTASYTVNPMPTTAMIANFLPASASTIAPTDTIEFVVLDDQPFDHVVYIRHEDTQETEIIGIGGGTVPAVASNPGRFALVATPTTGGYHYALSSLDGWKFPFTVFVEVYGRTIAGESEVHASGWASYLVSPMPVASYVSAAIPPTGSTLAPTDTFDIEIIGDATKTTECIFIGYGGGLLEPYALVAVGLYGATMFAVNPDFYTVVATPISGGYRYTIGCVTGWQRGFTVFVISQDAGFVESGIGPSLSLGSVDYSVDPSVPLDADPPASAVVSPAPGTEITAATPIVFDVTDDSGLMRRVLVAVYYAATGITELVHDGDTFLGRFMACSRVAIENGFRYTVVPSGGWTSSPTIRIFAIDRTGKEV